MAATTASAFSAAVQSTVQPKVLKNLRDQLIWGNPRWSEQGNFNQQTDTLTFMRFPDLSITTPLTPIAEGTTPTTRALTMTTVTIATSQYADVVGLTDVAKVKGPSGITDVMVERCTRAGKEVMDRVARDAIFLGGTPFYGGDATTRASVGTNDSITGAALIKLNSTMKKNKVPTFPDGSYILFAGNDVVYDLKAETTATVGWTDVIKYTDPSDVINGEVGKAFGFRIVETTTNPTFASTQTVRASLAIGDIKGWGAGELQSFRTYYHAPGGDHSDPVALSELAGWKVMFGVATLNNSYYYRFESYATTL